MSPFDNSYDHNMLNKFNGMGNVLEIVSLSLKG